MAIWDKVKEGIDKAGKAAQDAFDEGKTRIDAYRVREQADKAAEALGYAVFRAADAGREIDAETRDRLTRALKEKDAEARRLEADLANNGKEKPGTPPPAADASAAGAAGAAGPGTSEPGAAPGTPPASGPSSTV